MAPKILICATDTKAGRSYAGTIADAVGGEICFWEDMALEIRTSQAPVFQCGAAWEPAPPAETLGRFDRDGKPFSVAEMIAGASVPVPLEKPIIRVWHKGRDLAAEGYDIALMFGWYGEGRFGHYGDLAMALGTLLHDAGVTVWNSETYRRAWRTKIGLTFLLAFNNCLVPDTLYAPDPACALACLVPGRPYVVKDASGTHGRSNYLTDDPVRIMNALRAHRSLIQDFVPNDHDLRVICFGSEASLVMERSRSDDATHLNNTTKGGHAEWAGDVPDKLREISRRIADLSYCDMAGIDFIETAGDKGVMDYWCLEVNAISQLTSGFDVSRKPDAFAEAVRRHGGSGSHGR